MTHLPAVLCAAFTALLVVAEARRHAQARAVTKTAASTAFIVYAVTSGAMSAGWPGRWVLLALVLSMAGDLFLLSRSKPAFLAGLVAFLLAHVAYVAAFGALGLDLVGVVVTAVPVAVIALAVWRWLRPHVRSMARPVVAYVVVISLMVACAGGAAWNGASPGRAALFVAAVAFFLSDLCVARDRFVTPGLPNRAIGLPLYYGAQLGFAGAIAAA